MRMRTLMAGAIALGAIVLGGCSEDTMGGEGAGEADASPVAPDASMGGGGSGGEPEGDGGSAGEPAGQGGSAGEPGVDDPCSMALGVDCATFEQGFIKASDSASGDAFGVSVALSGDTLAVGADARTDNRGAVYVFTRADGIWSERARLTPPIA